MYQKVKSQKTSFGLQKTADKAKKLVALSGLSEASADGTHHSYAEEEKLAFVDWINYQLEKDTDLSTQLPIEEDGEALFAAMHDGLVMW